MPRDPEGFEDLDAHFNRASTPQKTPKSSRKQQQSANASRTGTPLSHRKAASVLVAKPLKMISSKIAEHYKKEPRVTVSMSEVLEAANVNEEYHLDEENHLVDSLENEHIDRLARAKRELEEMSINSFDSTINNDHDHEHEHDNNDNTEVHLSSYIKSTLSASVHAATESSYENTTTASAYDAVDDDVLMDRLVEEMLVNDHDTVETADIAVDTVDPVNPKKTRGKNGSTGRKQSHGLARRPLTYLPGAEMTETGQRRSCRLKMEPLRYWANEKVCYGRAEDPSITLPVIVNVIKKPELDDPTFAMGLTRKRRRPVDGNVAKLKAQAFGPDCDVEAEVVCYERPGESEMRLVALSHHHVQGDPVKDNSFRIHTIFTEGSYMSSGQLIFPPLSQKPTKNSARHALVFYVITGSFRIEINRESFVVGPGGQFHVPRANHYTITHVTEDKSVEGRLFFCHCKDNAEM